MKQESSHFEQVRINNRKIIRNLLRNYPHIGKADLADLSGLSYPTVSAVLGELTESNEVLILPEPACRGGRPGALYLLNPMFHIAACAFLTNNTLYMRIYDVFGNKLKSMETPIPETISPEELVSVFTEIRSEYPSLSVVSLGIPGAVIGGQIQDLNADKLVGINLEKLFKEKAEITLLMENDVNVFVSMERDKWPDLVHIFINHDCIGSGILVNGNIIRGTSGYAGELEYIYTNIKKGRNVGEVLDFIGKNYSGNEKKNELIKCLLYIISSVVSVINPADVALSGSDFSEQDLIMLDSSLKEILPVERIPNLHIVSNTDELYHEGLLDMALNYLKKL